MMRGNIAQAPMQERGFTIRCTITKIARHCDDRAGTGADTFDGRNDRLRTITHFLDQVAGHPRERQQSIYVHLRQRTDDLVHVAARTEIAAGASKYHGLDIVCVLQLVKGIS
jgi:hypothetical protein